MLCLFLLGFLCQSGRSYRLLKDLSSITPRLFRGSSAQVPLSASTKQILLEYFDSGRSENSIFACPESLEPLELTQRFYGLITVKYLLEKRFGTKYPIRPYYVDFVNNEDGGNRGLGQVAFQNPLISFVYERGYRQNFKNFGFPGIDKEFEEAKEFFLQNNATSTVVDLSCGSGFMTRRFINSTR